MSSLQQQQQQHETRTSRSTPRPQPKLRSSCDACGEAKIRCDRSRPSCGRCAVQGVGCVYGVSRKAGKPPKRRPAAPLPVPPAQRPVGSGTTSVDLAGSGYDDIDIMLSPPEGPLALDSPFSTSYAAFQTWFPPDSLETLGALAGHGEGGGDPCIGRGHSCESELDPAPVDNLSAAATTAPTPPTPPPTIGHECTQESKEIMRRLYCAHPSNSVSDGVPARTLDLGGVLTRNREVAVRLALLLRCPCARSPHMAMLYASVLSRVLLWYRQAAWNTGAAGTASSSLSSSTFPATPPSLVGTHGTTPPLSSSSAMLKLFDPAGAADDINTGVSVLPEPVTVGAFQSDDRTLQTALANRLVLSELKRVRSLIESFVSLGTSTPDFPNPGDACPAAGEFSPAVADASLFASLGAWLRSEHARVEWKARSGLSVLDETNSF
ncbi:Sterigmatocystin biosynthesis regulatory protein [Staphylotrichum tortipilum]|uniref:Sterigmatocystin biosynthesis regulatory protein n=1 Tax=Staphylotrichum tortipilum TaxID=2831512 RepID=A0AAN6RU05_9PEZI|nr:Sterigmatocystin biosynthesis regulatory protein [Staphylotrichum longicolle]